MPKNETPGTHKFHTRKIRTDEVRRDAESTAAAAIARATGSSNRRTVVLV
jgi:hypothetical protein